MPIHSTAHIDPTAEIDESCDIGPNVRIGAGCKIGPGNVFMDGAILGPNTIIGENNTFHFHSVVGHEPQFLGFDPATKSGTIIGNRNHFREFCQIHRGLKDDQNTVIGDENFFMATSHVAHDCLIGNQNVLANYAGLAGHVSVANKVFISTLVGVHQYARIGSYAMIGGRSGISKDVPPYTMIKHYGLVVGLNVVGLRRAGLGPETRKALKDAYQEIFRSGRPLPKSLEIVRDRWIDKEMPDQLTHLLDFCSEKSKRGLCRGPRKGELSSLDEGGDE